MNDTGDRYLEARKKVENENWRNPIVKVCFGSIVWSEFLADKRTGTNITEHPTERGQCKEDESIGKEEIIFHLKDGKKINV